MVDPVEALREALGDAMDLLNRMDSWRGPYSVASSEVARVREKYRAALAELSAVPDARDQALEEAARVADRYATMLRESVPAFGQPSQLTGGEHQLIDNVARAIRALRSSNKDG